MNQVGRQSDNYFALSIYTHIGVFVEIGLEQSNASYPALKKQNANSYYLGLIQNLYAGSEGELASFLQTSYQSALLYEQEDICLSLQKIAEQDKKHMQLLSHAIIMLGGTPKYFNAQNKWFSTREIDYVQSLKQIVSLDIEMKEKSILDYKSTIQKVSSLDLKATLTRILQDENNHLGILKNIYSNL